MPPAKTPWELCENWFATRPEAVWEVNRDGMQAAMLVVDRDRRYWRLTRTLVPRGPAWFDVRPWHQPQYSYAIALDTAAGDVHRVVLGPLEAGAAVPRHGALYAYRPWRAAAGGSVPAVMALIMFATSPHRQREEPQYATLVRGLGPAASWPSFAGPAPAFGPWFWDYRAAGTIIPAGPALARHPGRMFWVPDRRQPAGRIAVAQPVRLDPATVITEGVFVPIGEAQSAGGLPGVHELLAGRGVMDLAAKGLRAEGRYRAGPG
jgi:hypothetical protein